MLIQRIGDYDVTRDGRTGTFAVVNRTNREDVDHFTSRRDAIAAAAERVDLVDGLDVLRWRN